MWANHSRGPCFRLCEWHCRSLTRRWCHLLRACSDAGVPCLPHGESRPTWGSYLLGPLEVRSVFPVGKRHQRGKLQWGAWGRAQITGSLPNIFFNLFADWQFSGPKFVRGLLVLFSFCLPYIFKGKLFFILHYFAKVFASCCMIFMSVYLWAI